MIDLYLWFSEDFEKKYNEYISKLSLPKEIKTLSFDSSTSLLLFNSKTIEISKTKNSDSHYLLDILFKNKEKVWACDEIWEDPYFHSENKEYDPKTDWRKIYNSARLINEKVAIETTIKDFLNSTKTSVSINKKYIQ
jgi:hypothetical protein